MSEIEESSGVHFPNSHPSNDSVSFKIKTRPRFLEGKKADEDKRRKSAWIALGLVLLGYAFVPLLIVLGVPMGGVVPLPFIVMFVVAFGLAIRNLQLWPARIALLLFLLVLIGSFTIKATRPDPFEPHAHKISNGMTLADVKDILGERYRSEDLAKLAKVNLDQPVLRDKNGNSVSSYVSPESGGKLLLFKIRNTNIEVIFDDNDRVTNVVEFFFIPTERGG